MLFSAKAEYACVAMMELASRHGDPRPVRLTDIADKHGIVAVPVSRTVPAAEAAGFLRANHFGGRSADDLPRVVVSPADLSTLYRIADGGLSPLTGPMTREEYDRVLDEEVIVRGGKKY